MTEESGAAGVQKWVWGKAVFGLLFASFGFVALRFILSPVRLKILTTMLSPEAYGSLTLISLTIGLVTEVASLGSLEFLLRKLPGRDMDYQQAMFKTVVYYFGILSIVLAAVWVGIHPAWNPLKMSGLDNLACGLLLILTVHLTQYSYYLFGRTAYAHARLLQLLYAEMWFLPLLVFAWMGGVTVSQVLWIWVGWLALSFVIGQKWLPIAGILRIPISSARLKEVLAFGVPLLPLILSDWIFRVQDRYVLAYFCDLTTVANYNICIQIATVGTVVGVAVIDILLTEFFNIRNRIPVKSLDQLVAHEDVRHAFTLMIRYGLILMIPVVAVLCLAGEPAIRFISDPRKYLVAAPILPWTASIPPLTLLTIILGRSMLALDRGKQVGLGSLAAGVLCIGLSCLLAPSMGGRGTALANTISLAFLSVYFVWQMRAWRWIQWKELNLLRVGLAMILTVLGFLAVTRWVHWSALVVLVTGGIWSLACMIVLGLVKKKDKDILFRSVSGK